MSNDKLSCEVIRPESFLRVWGCRFLGMLLGFGLFSGAATIYKAEVARHSGAGSYGAADVIDMSPENTTWPAPTASVEIVVIESDPTFGCDLGLGHTAIAGYSRSEEGQRYTWFKVCDASGECDYQVDRPSATRQDYWELTDRMMDLCTP